MTHTTGYTIAIDTGGTFTDLVIDTGEEVRLHKAPTTPSDPACGVLDVIALAAEGLGMSQRALLAATELLIHGTTHAINALITHNMALTAFLTTRGHPDILLFREGGRSDPFDFSVPYPDPLVPRALTFEVPERIASDGTELEALGESAVLEIIEQLKARDVEAVGVCLLWSIVQPAHELRVAELIAEHLPGVPFTLSHALNPTIREYRRASSTCIDASLKPLMSSYFAGLGERLVEAGFTGRLLIVTSQGGTLDAADVADAPIHAINSGPAMAPVAGRYYTGLDTGIRTAIIADTGGTTFDVSLVRDGHIPRTSETWLGQQYAGHITGFPSVDVTSVGAGNGGMLFVDSVEIDELNFPLVVHEQRIDPDTEGAGRRRGAPSARVEYGPLHGELALVYSSDGHEFAAQGLLGGLHGASSSQFRRSADGSLEPLPGQGEVTLRSDETVVVRTTAGGGFGSPSQREPERVAHDVTDGWISATRAREVYRVAVNTDGTVDRAATTQLRKGGGR